MPKRQTRATRILPDMTRWMASLFSLAGMLALGTLASAQEGVIIKTHGYSYYGELKYPADFPHFDYVNPEAPKGGEISIATQGTFDSMNPYSRKGQSGALASMTYESLLGESLINGQMVSMPADVFGELYGLLAESLEYPETKDWVIFHMRPEARFSDGTPLTAHDVAFSHNLLLDQGLKSYGDAVRKRIPKVEVIDDHTIKFFFATGISRRSLIDQVGTVPVWSKKWYDENEARLDEGRLETAPGSGPYVIDSVDVNRRIVYRRNPDYWGAALPINIGRHNFDSIRIEYFADTTAAFEGFKSGAYTFRSEGESRKWATGYNFPKVASGAVKLETLPDGSVPPATGIVFNLGSEVFKDKRVRQAAALAFNFEWTNESLQFNLFEQRRSFLQGTDMMAADLPSGAELEFLKKLGDVVPPEIFSEPVPEPHTSDPSRLRDRRNVRKASALLNEAGWAVGTDGQRRNADGQTLDMMFLLNSSGSPTGRAIMENYVENLKGLGVNAVLDAVDSAQYTSRRRDRDYDMIFGGYRAFQDTGTGLQQMFGSEAAGFSLFNPAGVSSLLVDAIIEASLVTGSLEEEKASLMALDRALRHEVALIPVWYKPAHWVAYYDQYEHPETIPPLDLGYLDYWWYDAEKAAKLRASGALR